MNNENSSVNSVKITFPDGNSNEYPVGTTVLEVAEKIGPRLAMASLAAKVNGKLVDVSYQLNENSQLQILTNKDKEGIDVLRHSAAHLFAQAMLRLYPETKLTIGPVVDNGFYYDLDSDRTFSTQDFAAIELEMEKIVREDLPVTREEISKSSALKLFATNPYKVEMIENMEESDSSDKISIYRQGTFFDLCRGPHVPRTSKLKEPTSTQISAKPLSLTIHMHFRDKYVWNEDWPVAKELTRLTNIKLINTASKVATNSTEQYNLLMATGKLPDIIGGDALKDNFIRLGLEGAFQPLPPTAHPSPP